MTRLPVKFDQPPVIEVVCGVLFGDLVELRAAHIGLYWGAIRHQFPRSEDRQPLNAAIEMFDGTNAEMQIQLLEVPPLPRAWFISDDGRRLVQFQRDRFLYNWKSVSKDDPYPSYDQIIVQFESMLAGFEGFVKEEGLGPLSIRQYEMSYINHIGTADGVEPAAMFVDHQRSAGSDRFLPPQEHVSWRASYPLPYNEGRLHLSAANAVTMTGEKIIRFDVTARGMPRSGERRVWFDLAHEWITHGFADATSPVLHRLWKRTQ